MPPTCFKHVVTGATKDCESWGIPPKNASLELSTGKQVDWYKVVVTSLGMKLASLKGSVIHMQAGTSSSPLCEHMVSNWYRVFTCKCLHSVFIYIFETASQLLWNHSCIVIVRGWCRWCWGNLLHLQSLYIVAKDKDDGKQTCDKGHELKFCACDVVVKPCESQMTIALLALFPHWSH